MAKNSRSLRITALFALLIVSACGTKKRTYADRAERPTKEVRVPNNPTPVPQGGVVVDKTELYPMPEDPGRFIRFTINSVEDYISTFSDIAQQEMKAYGIPASITLAQGILESGAGRGELTQKTNNHFGIKCHQNWTGAVAYHDDDEEGECFRRYNHPMYSFRDHSVFLSSRARYRSLFDLKRTDYHAWARGLRQAGYATDPRYPQKLTSLIERYKLYRYDDEVIRQGMKVKRDPIPTEIVTYKVKAGDTLYGISKKFFVSVKELMSFNGLKSTLIEPGQQLKIRKESR
jgi:flagellum-specific peptidoglycan hydrolase FlgJ